jgi:Cyclin, N-terminal domain
MEANLIESDIFDDNDDLARCYDTVVDCLKVLMEQEVTAYKIGDYMNRRRRSRGFRDTVTNLQNMEDDIDPAFRGKMAEWSYRICDHFGTNREIVAVSFSFLDRFMDRFNCDRCGFKLAAMTSMYIASKMVNVKGLRVGSFVEMCRGEFQEKDFVQMERVILSALDFRLNPPIVQSFILQLCVFMPEMDDITASEILSRAIFYGELSVYDYKFVPLSNCQVAVGCILNAIFDCEKNLAMSELIQSTFLITLYANTCIKVNFLGMNDVQERLWYLYECSAESSFGTCFPDIDSSAGNAKYLANDKRQRIGQSPVSVTGLKHASIVHQDIVSSGLWN